MRMSHEHCLAVLASWVRNIVVFQSYTQELGQAANIASPR
jgi:hypothetical protein